MPRLCDERYAQLRTTNDSKIAELRIARGMTQAQLTEKVGCHVNNISRWERGERNPKLNAIMKIAEALEVDFRELL